MAYTPIDSIDDVKKRLVPGITREDHWLDFRRDRYGAGPRDPADCARDIAQFANASGGCLVIGADESDHVLRSFQIVPEFNELIRWIDDVVKGQLTPAPGHTERAITLETGETIVIVNVPPAPRLIARRHENSYEFPIRRFDSRGYLTLLEVEARMQDRERLMRLRIEQIRDVDSVELDADIPTQHQRGWRVKGVDDHAVTLSMGALDLVVPLSYMDSVYKANEPDATWIVSLSCSVQMTSSGGRSYFRVRKHKLGA